MKHEERGRWGRNVNCRKWEESVGATEGDGRSSNDEVGVNLISISGSDSGMEGTNASVVYAHSKV